MDYKKNSHSRIPRSRYLSPRNQRPNILQLRICQIEKDGVGVLIEILDRLCSGNRNNVRALSKKPCNSNLGRSARVVIGNIFQPLNQFEDLWEVFLCVLGEDAAEIIFRNIGERLDLSSQDASANGTVGNDSDTKFTAGSQNIGGRRFNVQSERTVFHLVCCNGVDSVGTAQSCS